MMMSITDFTASTVAKQGRSLKFSFKAEFRVLFAQCRAKSMCLAVLNRETIGKPNNKTTKET